MRILGGARRKIGGAQEISEDKAKEKELEQENYTAGI